MTERTNFIVFPYNFIIYLYGKVIIISVAHMSIGISNACVHFFICVIKCCIYSPCFVPVDGLKIHSE